MEKTLHKQMVWVVEDEEDLLALIHYTLMKEGYEVRGFTSGEEVLQALVQEQPDLLLLDIMLPGIDGLEICNRLKSQEKTRRIPVIMVTAKSEEDDIVIGLNLGADDYVAKPFSPKVLSARVRSVLRRQGQGSEAEGEVIRQGDMVIDPNRHQVLLAGALNRLRVQDLALSGEEARVGFFAGSDYQRHP